MGKTDKQPGTQSSLTEPELNVLLSLAQGTRHGYAIMLEARKRTDGRVSMGAGTLYGCLKRMAPRGLIQESEHHRSSETAGQARRRYYELTRAGEEALVAEIELMQGYVRTAHERNVHRFAVDDAPPPGRRKDEDTGFVDDPAAPKSETTVRERPNDPRQAT